MADDKGLSQKGKDAIALMDRESDALTIKSRSDRWISNAIANRDVYKNGNPPLVGLVAFVVAAGPSLKKNVEQLKNVGPRGVILCVDAAYRFLIQSGIVPDYCMCIDSDARMLKMIEGVDTSKTALIAMASASPELVSAWKGQRFFVRCVGGRVDIDDKLIAVAREIVANRDIKKGEILHPLDDVTVAFKGLGYQVASGGNVTTSAHSFAAEYLKATHIVFVGADYSWVNPEEFYAGGEHEDMGFERQDGEGVFTHRVRAEEVCTNLSMFRFKDWHEDFAKLLTRSAVESINATEGGILGIDREGNDADGWKHLTLAEAIARYAPK